METLSEILNVRLRPSDARTLDRLRRGTEKGEFMRKLLNAEDVRIKRRISDGQPVCSDPLHAAGVDLLKLFHAKLGGALDAFLAALVKAFGSIPDVEASAAKQATPAAVPGSMPQSEGHDPRTGAVSPATTDNAGFLSALLVSAKRNDALEALVQPTAVEENRRRGGGS